MREISQSVSYTKLLNKTDLCPATPYSGLQRILAFVDFGIPELAELPGRHQPASNWLGPLLLSSPSPPPHLYSAPQGSLHHLLSFQAAVAVMCLWLSSLPLPSSWWISLYLTSFILILVGIRSKSNENTELSHL